MIAAWAGPSLMLSMYSAGRFGDWYIPFKLKDANHKMAVVHAERERVRREVEERYNKP